MAIDNKTDMNNDSLNLGSDIGSGLGSSAMTGSSLNSDINPSSAASPADRNYTSTFDKSSSANSGASTFGAGTQSTEIGMDQDQSQNFQSQGFQSNMSSNLHSNVGSQQTNVNDTVQDALGQIVDSVFRAIQPRIHDAVTQFANRAVGASDHSARQLVTSARRNPWYTVGGVALLVVGLGLVLGLDAKNQNVAANELH